MGSWSVLGAPSPSENLKMLYEEDSKNQFGLASFGMSNQGFFRTSSQPNILDEGDDGEDEEQLLSHPPNGKKRRLTVDQVKVLEESFEKENKLEPERKALIAKNLGLSPRQVAIWFQNRRARWKTKQLEQAFEHLKAKLETALSENKDLLKDKEIMVEENKRLRKQVDHLMALWESSERGGSSCEEDMGRGDKEELNTLPNCKAVDGDVIKKEAKEEEEDQEEEEQGHNQDGCFSSNGKSELTDSPTMKSGDQSEMQDSGRSYPPTNAAVEAAQQKVDQEGFDELPYEDSAVNLAVCPLIKLEDASLLYTEEALSGWLNHQPFIFQHLAVSGGTYLEDAYTHISDQYAGFSWCD